MIDIHNHAIPGVDDGASGLEESRTALGTLWREGVRGMVVTPHLQGSLTTSVDGLSARLEELDRGWVALAELASSEYPDLSLGRGAEVMLDTPNPDLSDPRVRLAGTSFVLVEFPFMNIPPNSTDSLFGLRMNGWRPVVAHPERYARTGEGLRVFEEWRRVGGLLQVNCGSLLGRYGEAARSLAWRLLHAGLIDYLASDYHARGRCALREAADQLASSGADEQRVLLMEENPRRLLAGEAPEPVPPFAGTPSAWSRIRRLLR